MADNQEPVVVVIDDEPDKQEAFASALRRLGLRAIVVHPNDLQSTTLARAAVVVVDQYLKNWPERDALGQVGLRVTDGLSLASVLRAQLDERGSMEGPIPSHASFVLRSGDLGTLGRGMPDRVRDQLIARQHNIEWVVEKGSARSDSYGPESQIAALAFCVASRAGEWQNFDQYAWLDLPDASWKATAQWQIEQCRPPVHEISASTAGREWTRWFLQKASSFPTFLIDDVHAATILGITIDSFEELLVDGSALAGRVHESAYRGQLSNFFGRRWWRAGVSDVAKSSTPNFDLGASTRDVGEAIAGLASARVEVLDLANAVIPIDEQYRSLPPIDSSESVRLQPDDWPPYADVPWGVARDIEQSAQLAALVVLDDRYLVTTIDGAPRGTSQL